MAVFLRPEDFYGYAAGLAFAAMLGVWERGTMVDAVTVADEIHHRGQTADVPYTYLADLWESEPVGALAEHYARIVADKAQVRRVLLAAGEILHIGGDGQCPGNELCEQAEKLVFAAGEVAAAGQGKPLVQVIDAACAAIEERAANPKPTGILSGLSDLDALTCGFKPSELVIIGARPSVGKTSLACVIALYAAKHETPTLFVSLEQSATELGERLLAMEAEVDSHNLRRGKLQPEEWQRLFDARNRLREPSITIDDAASQSMLRIAANARRLRRRQGVGLVVIDYLQLIDPDNRRESRIEQVSAITRRAKLLAKEVCVPVVMLAQLNRGPETGNAPRKPRVSDLRECGSQEQDADIVTLLWNPDENNDDPIRQVEIIVGKNRNGRTGECLVGFRKSCMRFENLATGNPNF